MINDIPQIPVDELARRLDAGAQLVDVRERHEFVSAHVPGAVHLPLSEWPDAATSVPAAGQIHLICARGGRSQKAAEFLAAQGRDVVNVDGGTMGWVDSGFAFATGAAADVDA